MPDKRLQIDINAKDKTKAAFQAVRKGLGTLTQAAKAMGAAIAIGGVATGVMLRQMAKSIDETGKLSRQLGISVKDLESFKLAADLGGSSLETFSKASKQLSKNVFDFVKRGTGEAKDAFKELGITSGDLIPIINDNVAVFDLVADRFTQMENGAVKTATAVKLFGNRAVEMLSVFEGGTGTLKQAREEAERFGLVLTEKQVKAVEMANDEFTKLGSVVTGIIKQITGELFPKIGKFATMLREEVLTSIEDSFGSVNNFAKFISDKVSEFTKGAALSLVTASKNISVGFLQFGKFSLLFLDGFLSATQTLIDVMEPLKEAIDGLKNWNPFTGFFGSGESKSLDMPSGMMGIQPSLFDRESKPIEKAKSVVSKSASSKIKDLRSGIQQKSGSIDETISSMEEYFQIATDWIENFGEAQGKVEEASEMLQEDLKSTNELLNDADDKVSDLNVAMQRLANASDEAGNVIAKNFEDAIFKAKSFGDALRSVGDELLRLAFRKTVTEPLAEGLSSFIGGFFSGGDTVASAKGNVFQGGKLKAFAKGGIVGSPTLFPMKGGSMGLMSENEPEAIMPLKRDAGGRLGVSATGFRGNNGAIVNVNVIDQRSKGQDVEVKQGKDSQGNQQISVLIRDEVRRGFAEGAFDRSLQVFGINRGGLRSV